MAGIKVLRTNRCSCDDIWTNRLESPNEHIPTNPKVHTSKTRSYVWHTNASLEPVWHSIFKTISDYILIFGDLELRYSNISSKNVFFHTQQRNQTDLCLGVKAALLCSDQAGFCVCVFLNNNRGVVWCPLVNKLCKINGLWHFVMAFLSCLLYFSNFHWLSVTNADNNRRTNS